MQLIYGLFVLILNKMFFDTIKGFAGIYQFIMDSKQDANIKELLAEYNEKYLIYGWQVISSFIKALLIIGWILSQIFVNSRDPFYRTISIVPIVIIFIIVILNEWINKNHFIRDNLFMFAVGAYGSLWIYANTSKEEYSILEFWLMYNI